MKDDKRDKKDTSNIEKMKKEEEKFAMQRFVWQAGDLSPVTSKKKTHK